MKNRIVPIVAIVGAFFVLISVPAFAQTGGTGGSGSGTGAGTGTGSGMSPGTSPDTGYRHVARRGPRNIGQ